MSSTIANRNILLFNKDKIKKNRENKEYPAINKLINDLNIDNYFVIDEKISNNNCNKDFKYKIEFNSKVYNYPNLTILFRKKHTGSLTDVQSSDESTNLNNTSISNISEDKTIKNNHSKIIRYFHFSKQKDIKCYICEEVGHSMVLCPKRNEKFCIYCNGNHEEYKCIFLKCPKCNENCDLKNHCCKVNEGNLNNLIICKACLGIGHKEKDCLQNNNWHKDIYNSGNWKQIKDDLLFYSFKFLDDPLEEVPEKNKKNFIKYGMDKFKYDLNCCICGGSHLDKTCKDKNKIREVLEKNNSFINKKRRKFMNYIKPKVIQIIGNK